MPVPLVNMWAMSCDWLLHLAALFVFTETFARKTGVVIKQPIHSRTIFESHDSETFYSESWQAVTCPPWLVTVTFKLSKLQSWPSCSLRSSKVALPEMKACILTISDKSCHQQWNSGKAIKHSQALAENGNKELYKAYSAYSILNPRVQGCSRHPRIFKALWSRNMKCSFIVTWHPKVQAAFRVWPTNSWRAHGPSQKGSLLRFENFLICWELTFKQFTNSKQTA